MLFSMLFTTFNPTLIIVPFITILPFNSINFAPVLLSIASSEYSGFKTFIILSPFFSSSISHMLSSENLGEQFFLSFIIFLFSLSTPAQFKIFPSSISSLIPSPPLFTDGISLPNWHSSSSENPSEPIFLSVMVFPSFPFTFVLLKVFPSPLLPAFLSPATQFPLI